MSVSLNNVIKDYVRAYEFENLTSLMSEQYQLIQENFYEHFLNLVINLDDLNSLSLDDLAQLRNLFSEISYSYDADEILLVSDHLYGKLESFPSISLLFYSVLCLIKKKTCSFKRFQFVLKSFFKAMTDIDFGSNSSYEVGLLFDDIKDLLNVTLSVGFCDETYPTFLIDEVCLQIFQVLIPKTNNISTVDVSYFVNYLGQSKYPFYTTLKSLKDSSSNKLIGYINLLYVIKFFEDDSYFLLWPTIVTHKVELFLFLNLFHFYLVSLEINHNYCDDKTFSRSLELANKLLSHFEHDISSNDDKLFLAVAEALMKMTLQPISSASIPSYMNSSLKVCESLFNAATFKLSDKLFTQGFELHENHMHHGLHGFLIGQYKNMLHYCLTGNLNELESKEYKIEKDNDYFPLRKQCLYKQLQSIFKYPSFKRKDETLLDETSWILTALNFIIYISIRCKNDNSFSEGIITIKKHLEKNFFTPLENTIEENINVCHTTEASNVNSGGTDRRLTKLYLLKTTFSDAKYKFFE